MKYIFIILFIFITLGLYLVILGSNLNKDDREKWLEDIEQRDYLREYKNKKILVSYKTFLHIL